MSWRLAHSLATLRDEINTAAPGRSKVSDGTIGDAAHAKTKSDHNPNAAGVVRAIDITDDPAGGCSAREIADRVAAMLGQHPALGPGAYVIFDGRIISTSKLGESWRPYTGLNAHEKHVHISVATAATGYDSTKRWGVMAQPALPKRVRRYLAELKARRAGVKREIRRLKAARDVAKTKGEDLTPYRTALDHARRARKQLRKTRQKAKQVDRR